MVQKKGGCLQTIFIIIGVMIAIPIGKYLYSTIKAKFAGPPAYIESAAEIIEKRKKAFSNIDRAKPYDLDQTVMALYSIEKAVSEATNFEELTQFVLQEDSTLIAPDVRQLKFKFFAAYKDLLQTEDEIEDMNSIFKVASDTILTFASMLDTTFVSFDRSQSQKVWDRRVAQEDLEYNLKQRLAKQQEVFVNFLFEYQKVCTKYYPTWDKLCYLRDRAYLSIYEGDIEEAMKNAAAAVALAPYEKEAHILLARCLLENNNNDSSEEVQASVDKAQLLITDFLKKHNGQQAPGHLINGVIKLKQGNLDTAAVDFDQAAAYFPKQQQILNDTLSLYKKRSFLNNSREGRVIINMYRAMMCGSGYFSPDFQKARLHLQRNEKKDAKTKIFDHFYRRRLQGQWDRILSDYHYAKQFLEDESLDFNPEDELKLEIDSTMFTNSVKVKVMNKGENDIHNVTVLLCVRFTEMFPGDFISFPVGKTQALLAANSDAHFGKQHLGEIALQKLGKEKEFEDIIEYAAVLISDELITWVEPQDVTFIHEEKATLSVTLPDTSAITGSASNVVDKAIGAITEKTQKALDSVSKDQVNTLIDKALEAIKEQVMEK